MPNEASSQRQLGIAPNPGLKFWREVGQHLVKESIASVDGAGKQIIAAASILEGLYFHAVTFSELRGTLTWWEASVYLLPILLWLLALWFAASIFFPRRYAVNISSSEASKHVYTEIVEQKLERFRIAAVFLGLGVLGLLVPLTYYLVE